MRRSNTSASAPPHSPKTTSGTSPKTPVSPTYADEPVIGVDLRRHRDHRELGADDGDDVGAPQPAEVRVAQGAGVGEQPVQRHPTTLVRCPPGPTGTVRRCGDGRREVPNDDWLVRGTPRRARSPTTTTRGRRATTPTSTPGPTRRPARSPTSSPRSSNRRLRWLDVGCGTGLVGKALRARGFTGRVVGLDISQVSLRLAQQSGAYDDLQPADLQQPLPLDDDGVDALVCVGVMTYLPDVEAIVARVRARRTPRRARRRDPARGPVAAPPLPGRDRPARGGRRLDPGRRPRPGAVPAGRPATPSASSAATTSSRRPSDRRTPGGGCPPCGRPRGGRPGRRRRPMTAAPASASRAPAPCRPRRRATHDAA